MKAVADVLPRVAFFFGLLVIGFGYGYISHRFGWFPSSWIRQAEIGWQELREHFGKERPWYYFDTEYTETIRMHQPDKVAPGLTLLSMVTADRGQIARVVDADGAIINEWNIDWFHIWPDATHLPDSLMPRTPPGTVVHGMLMMEDGGIVYNYDALGLVRLDVCGKVVWRLPLGTHHSLHRDERGDIWTSIRHVRQPGDPDLTGYVHPYDEYTIAKISADGDLLDEVSIFDLLRENSLESLLYLSSWGDQVLETGGDSLHVNDVEVFPSTLEAGVFEPGDVMVSMRRTNTVIVFDWQERKVRYVSFGPFIRQHDPDFVDGNTISVFDNNNIGRPHQGIHSRIVLISAHDGSVRVPFSGSAEQPFFTSIMGKHQYLDNGNMLLVESVSGRVLEVDGNGRPVWEYVNFVEEGVIGLVAEGTRLPQEYDRAFFAGQRAACEN